MSVPGPKGYALNRTRNTYLATRICASQRPIGPASAA